MDSGERPPSLEDIGTAPTTMPAPQGTDWQVSYEKLKEKFDQVTELLSTLKEENDRLKGPHRTREILDDLIKPYAIYVFKFMCYYSAFVGVMLALNGFKLAGFSLPESSVNFLVGSTAATVIGLVGMVVTGVFIGARK